MLEDTKLRCKYPGDKNTLGNQFVDFGLKILKNSENKSRKKKKKI